MLLTVASFFVVLSYSVFFVFYNEVCYAFVSISTTEQIPENRVALVKRLVDSVGTKVYCGKRLRSDFLTIENLSKSSIVSQVALQWKTPEGWSYTDLDYFDIFNNEEIMASNIINKIHQYVYSSRVAYLAPLFYIWTISAVAILFFGIGITWVVLGFKPALK